MIEINQKQAYFLTQKKDYHIIFVNSPFCGTCKVARRMLEYIEETLGKEIFYELNVTLAPNWVQEHEVTSVPCLMVFKKGDNLDRLYTFHSVPYLLKEMGPYLV
ncbi:thioredoxin family protein [Piscibacillus sp. B03]|uniref:thioredoxin family protein n=1 Tax=Piscibacillus sp. B03 TaxID=3457430 RepID=UPI003FCE471B